MSLESILQNLDRRIRATRNALEAAYASSAPDEEVDALFRSLALLEDERALGRWYWADRVLEESLSAYLDRWLRELCGKFLEIANRHLPELERLNAERKRSQPAFWRAVVPSQRTAFAGAQAIGANGRPVWGYRRKMGRR